MEITGCEFKDIGKSMMFSDLICRDEGWHYNVVYVPRDEGGYDRHNVYKHPLRRSIDDVWSNECTNHS